MATLLQPTHRPLRAGRVRLGLVCALGAVVALASLAAGSDAGATPSAPVVVDPTSSPPAFSSLTVMPPNPGSPSS